MVPEDHRSYRSGALVAVNCLTRRAYRKTVVSQFRLTWRHNTTCPEVKAVYKIIISGTSLKQYQQYLYERCPSYLTLS